MMRGEQQLGSRAGVMLLLALAVASCDSPPRPAPRVLIVSVDTLRADHLSAYGYPRDTSPFLEELAGRGVLFDHAFTQATDTTPSHASLFTALYPFAHGAANGVPLDGEFVTLAEILGRRGYCTAAFVSGWTMTADSSGLGQGFDVYDDTLTQAGSAITEQPSERTAAETTDRAVQWLAANAEEPFLLFVHYFDPHARYLPPAPYDTMFPPTGKTEILLAKIPPYARVEGETNLQRYVSLYDGEIRYVDDQIRRLFDELDARGLLQDTLVVISADHGESLTEHGLVFAHGWNLFDPSLRVPLILSWPGRLPEGRRVESLAQNVDVLPTVLELLDVPVPDDIDGRSLLPGIEGREEAPNPFAVAKTTKVLTYLNLDSGQDLHDHYAIRTADWKYLLTEQGGGALLFDLRGDPLEQRDVLAQHPADAESLRLTLSHILDERQVDTSGFLEPLGEDERRQLEERLRALGYIR